MALLLSLWMLSPPAVVSAFAAENPNAADVSLAQNALLAAMSSARKALTSGKAPDDQRLADLLVLEFGARRASSLETVGHWQNSFDSWAQNISLPRPYGPPEAAAIRGQRNSADALQTGINFRALQNLNTESLAMVYDGAASQFGPPAVPVGPPPQNPAAPQKGKPGAKLQKPKIDPPVSPQSNPEALIEAVAVLPRGYWDGHKNKRVVVARETQLEIAKIAVEEAALQGQDPLWVLAFLSKESAFNAAAAGPFGEFGLMQLMTATARNLAKQTPGMEALVLKSAYRRKNSARTCDLLAEKLIAEGKIVLKCGKVPVEAEAQVQSSKPPLKADYDVEYLDLHDPRTNIRLGVAYIKSLWDTFSKIPSEALFSVDPRKRKDIKAAISAYNAGAPVVARTLAKFGRPPTSTEAYVDTFIEDYYLKLNRRFQEIARTADL